MTRRMSRFFAASSLLGLIALAGASVTDDSRGLADDPAKVSEDSDAPEPEDTSDLPTGDPEFSLTSVFTPTNRQNLASIVSVSTL